MNFSVIVTAGGSSSRYGKTNKLLEKLNGKEVILHSIEAFFPFNPQEIIVSASESLEPVLKNLTKNMENIKNSAILFCLNRANALRPNASESDLAWVWQAGQLGSVKL